MRLSLSRRIVLAVYAIGFVLLTVVYVPVRMIRGFEGKIVDIPVTYRFIGDQSIVCPNLSSVDVPQGIDYSRLLAEVSALTVVCAVAFALAAPKRQERT